MINYNGTLQNTNSELTNNRAFLYGDAVFETLKVVNNNVLFLEDHYFRLMASMRILRMKIPMNFTLEFFENELLNLTKSLNIQSSARVRFTVYRVDGGLYLPSDRNVSYIIKASQLTGTSYNIDSNNYEVELYKDNFISKQILSTVKSTNKLLNTLASIFADENGYQNCLLLNDDKNVIEAINGNIFMKMGNKLITPPISDGCINGILRKQILHFKNLPEELELIEASISPFDLQKADELFITNVITGIQPITKYRKKEYKTDLSKELVNMLNSKFNL